MIKRWLFLVGICCANSVHAIAAEWHWEAFGDAGYSGRIEFKDHLGDSVSFERFDAAGSPSLFGSASVQSPVTVVAGGGSDIDIELVRSGLPRPKKECDEDAVWKAFVTPVTACNSGVATNIGGMHAWAVDDSESEFTPKLAVYVQGYGWREITNHACGTVQVQQLCKKIENP